MCAEVVFDPLIALNSVVLPSIALSYEWVQCVARKLLPFSSDSLAETNLHVEGKFPVHRNTVILIPRFLTLIDKDVIFAR